MSSHCTVIGQQVGTKLLDKEIRNLMCRCQMFSRKKNHFNLNSWGTKPTLIGIDICICFISHINSRDNSKSVYFYFPNNFFAFLLNFHIPLTHLDSHIPFSMDLYTWTPYENRSSICTWKSLNLVMAEWIKPSVIAAGHPSHVCRLRKEDICLPSHRSGHELGIFLPQEKNE